MISIQKDKISGYIVTGHPLITKIYLDSEQAEPGRDKSRAVIFETWAHEDEKLDDEKTDENELEARKLLNAQKISAPINSEQSSGHIWLSNPNDLEKALQALKFDEENITLLLTEDKSNISILTKKITDIFEEMNLPPEVIEELKNHIQEKIEPYLGLD